jgi:hypothetical protein
MPTPWKCYRLFPERLADGLAVHTVGALPSSWFKDEEVLGLVDQAGSGQLYLDCRRMEYLNSEDVGSLIVLDKRLRNQGGWLTLCHLQPAVLELFEIIRFNMPPGFFRNLHAKMPGSGPPRLLDPSWLSWDGGAIPQMVQGIHNEGRLSDLPIIADALEEAGCTNADMLAHLRGPGPHVRGCWVVDLLLGKQ